MKEKAHFVSLNYVILAGFIPTILMYYLFSKVMALVEDTTLTSIGAIITILSPAIAPVIGSLIFFKIKKNTQEINWRYVLIYSLVLIVILEAYFFFFEPVWNGLGLILGICNGIILTVVSLIKSKNTPYHPN